MTNIMKFILTSLLLCLNINQIYSDSPLGFVPIPTQECPNDLATTCNLQCPNGNYLFDFNGCPTCACAPSDEVVQPIDQPLITCPQIKCRANCGDAGYQLDENGCQTCKCVVKEIVQCSRVMCRMFCQYGFQRDENGCEFCSCNQSPQSCPQLNCQGSCKKYRIDYSGCQTCECDCPPMVCPASLHNCTKSIKIDADGCSVCSCNEQQGSIDNKCSSLTCDLQCKNGLQLDASGCELCKCNRCPLRTCRMYCMYGFRRNNDGCEVCECDWSPVAENIQCSERIPCEGTRVCNLNIKLCELVSPEKVNWFVYDFEVKTDLFNDPKFLDTFKNGLIRNIAAKYELETTQITISSVENDGMTSFQIMPFYLENLDDFNNKMDQIDIDLNSHEFRAVLPAVTDVIVDDDIKYPDAIVKDKVNNKKWKLFILQRPRLLIYIIGVVIGCIALIFAVVFFNILRRRGKYAVRSESKSPIYDPLYQQTSTDDDHYHAVHAPDGTTYVVVQTDDMQSSNDKRAVV